MLQFPPPTLKLHERDRRFIGRTTSGFIIALAALLALVIAGYIIQRRQIIQERDTSAMVSASANQRTLSQRVALLSLGLLMVQSESTREKAKKVLLSDIETMEAIHQSLIAGDPVSGIRSEKSEAVREIFFGESNLLDRKIRMFISNARILAEEGTPALTASDPKLNQLTEMSSELSRLFERLTEQYKHEGVAGILGLKKLATQLFFAQLGLILLSALLVFYPTIKRLRMEFHARTTAQAELMEQNQELEQFAATVAHDLKAPLNNIRGFSQFLRSELANQGNKESNEILDQIESGVIRMNQMISELMQYARVTREQRRLEKIPLRSVVEKILKDFEKKIKDDGAEVIVGELPTIVGVRMQLEHLFQNLISNALKYRHPERSPRIWVEQVFDRNEPEMEWIAVEDNGRGFPPGAEERMFEPFRRLRPNEGVEGSGFGLALCKKIVRRHNGTIAAEHATNGGARFVVSFPKN